MAVNINVPSQVRTFANLAAFPATGALKTIYIAEDTNKTYRWTGSVYTEISASAAMTWGAIGGTLSNQTDLQNALDAKVPTSRTLTINGVTQDLSANRTFTISTGITIGSTAIASGVVGRVLFEGAGNVVQESSSLFWDNTNARLGIGTSTPSNNLDVKTNVALGGISVTNTLSASFSAARVLLQADTTDISFFNQYNSASPFGLSNNGGFGSSKSIVIFSDADVASGGTSSIQFRTGGYNTAQERLRIASTGNVLINTTTDAGFRLDVNGTARVQGNFQVSAGVARFTSTIYPNIEVNSTQRYSIIEFLNTQSAKAAVALDNTDKYLDLSGYPTYGVRFNVNNTEAARFNNSTRNLLINTTTDAGFRLDVNGTARVQGNVTVTSGSRITVGNIELFDNTSGTRQINALGNQGLQITANSSNITINNSTGGNGSVVLNSTGSDGRIFLRPNGTSQGIAFSGSGSVPSFNQMTFVNNRNDGSKSAIINTADFNAGGLTPLPINLFLYAGTETFSGTQGNIFLAHDNSTARGGVAIGSNSINASAVLDVVSTTKGFLPPRLTTTQRNAIASPAAGLVVYDNTDNKHYGYNGTTWNAFY